MRKLAMLSLFAVFSAAAGSVCAEDLYSLPRDLQGSYMSVAYPQADILSESGSGGLKPLQDDAGSRLTLGYRLNKGLHLEAALSNMRYQPPGGGPGYMSSQAGSLSTVLYLPLTHTFQPFLKLGVAAVSAGSERDFVTSPVRAVGMVIPLDKGLSARIEIERFDKFGYRGGEVTTAYAGIQITM